MKDSSNAVYNKKDKQDYRISPCKLLDYDILPSEKVKKKIDYFYKPYQKEQHFTKMLRFRSSGDIIDETAQGFSNCWNTVRDFIYNPIDAGQKKIVIDLLLK